MVTHRGTVHRTEDYQWIHPDTKNLQYVLYSQDSKPTHTTRIFKNAMREEIGDKY
jgi:hypothetical protein